ncbi:MAG: DNA mismatch endonuclease Vsr [Nitrospiraceae bacterium]|nr:DNA mismatch endonuclease Vsr [Nitrospiraceae bacterium]
MDKISKELRSANMRLIRSTDTKPELVLRRLIHGLGYRFRLHRKDLPGRPDIVFPGRCKVIFIHGCFWHQHSECREGRMPGTRLDYWVPKLSKNQIRDAANRTALEEQGWSVLVVWECELVDISAVTNAVRRFLGRQGPARI